MKIPKLKPCPICKSKQIRYRKDHKASDPLAYMLRHARGCLNNPRRKAL